MGTLDLATGKARTPQKTVVQTYKGEPKGENLIETKITRIVDDEATLEAIREGRAALPGRARITDFPRFNPGLLFVPRP
jgi:hypothetical protein